MCRKIVVLAFGLVVASAPSYAQAPEMPNPAPEHEKLGVFVGYWTFEGELQPNPIMPGGAIAATQTCDWFEGGFAVVCRGEGSAPVGPTTELAILSYSTEEQAYTYYGIDNTGMVLTDVPLGTVDGDTWTYVSEMKMGGQQVKLRNTLTVTSPTSYTARTDMAGADGIWSTIVEGTATKAQ